jgi:hypothetical protein
MLRAAADRPAERSVALGELSAQGDGHGYELDGPLVDSELLVVQHCFCLALPASAASASELLGSTTLTLTLTLTTTHRSERTRVLIGRELEFAPTRVLGEPNFAHANRFPTKHNHYTR